MRILGLILTSTTKSAILGDAIASLRGHVHGVMIALLEGDGYRPDTPDDTVLVAQRACDVLGLPMILVTLDIASTQGGFGAARQAALDAAGCYADCYQWCVQLDTDERICPGSHYLPDICGQAEQLGIDCLMLRSDCGKYDRPRLVALPATGQWIGITHEDYVGYRQAALAGDIRVHELPKKPDELRARMIRDAEALRQMCQDDQACSRSHLYLGHTLEALAGYPDVYLYDLGLLLEEAREAYLDAAWKSDGLQAAWAYYRAAGAAKRVGLRSWAEDYLVDSQDSYPAMPESHWLRSVMHLEDAHDTTDTLDRQRSAWAAIACAHAAAALDWRSQQAMGRAGQQDPVAWYEGPWQVLGAAHQLLGHTEDAVKCIERAMKLAQMRGA